MGKKMLFKKQTNKQKLEVKIYSGYVVISSTYVIKFQVIIESGNYEC